MTHVRHLVLAEFCVLALTGCAATTARQSMTGPGPPASPRSSEAATPPTENGHSPSQAAQQSGQGNVTGQIEAGGWKGIEYSSAVPVGQVILMGLMLLLSHRREMARIKQNGRHGHQPPPER